MLMTIVRRGYVDDYYSSSMGWLLGPTQLLRASLDTWLAENRTYDTCTALHDLDSLQVHARDAQRTKKGNMAG